MRITDLLHLVRVRGHAPRPQSADVVVRLASGELTALEADFFARGDELNQELAETGDDPRTP
jgi:hypothetical protein